MADADYLTIPEVADLARCHKNTVRQAINEGELAAFRLAARLLVRNADARAWIESKPAIIQRPRTLPSVRRRSTVQAQTASEGW